MGVDWLSWLKFFGRSCHHGVLDMRDRILCKKDKLKIRSYNKFVFYKSSATPVKNYVTAQSEA